MSAQISHFARCANYEYPGLMWLKKKKKNPLLFTNLLNPFAYLLYTNMCAISSVYVCKQASTFVCIHIHIQMSMCACYTCISKYLRIISWAVCQMQNHLSHVPDLEWWPELAASLINLMDSELTWDEFIRWLHFTLLIFMLIGKAGQGQVALVRTHLTEWLVPYYVC